MDEDRHPLDPLARAMEAELIRLTLQLRQSLGVLVRRAGKGNGGQIPESARQGLVAWVERRVAILFGRSPADVDRLYADPRTVPGLIAAGVQVAVRRQAAAGGVPGDPADTTRTWVDPNGRVLSDRIWLAGEDARSRITAVLDAGIRRGTPPDELARELEAFLQPGVRAATVSGDDGLWAARRLARHEINRAGDRAVTANARGTGALVAWQVSIAHPAPDVCDGYMANGPYTPDQVPEKPHPLCMCFLRVVPGAGAGPSGDTMDASRLAAALTGF